VLADMAITQERVSAQLLALREMFGTPAVGDKPAKPLAMEEAARRTGVGHRQWQRWEAGESLPYTKNLSKVVEAFPEIGGLDYFDDGNAASERPSRLAVLEQELAELKALVRDLTKPETSTAPAVDASRAASSAAVDALDALAAAQPESPTRETADAKTADPPPAAPRRRQARETRGA
jgi:transcriptional regulator with XRE-family HTH domain